MKKLFTIIPGLIIILIFASIVYNTKRDDYKLHQEFYNKYFNGRIVKIIEGRRNSPGIYYNSEDYFHSRFCENSSDIEEIIRVGDVVKKKDSIIKFYRVDEDFNSVEILTCTVKKPADTYFSYFFD